MINLIGAYIVSICFIALLYHRPSIAALEQKLRCLHPVVQFVAYLLLALVGSDSLGFNSTDSGFFGAVSYFTSFLQIINLWIHEAGHGYLMWAGDRWHAAGGTLFQLLLPVLFSTLALFRRTSRCFFLGIFWLGLNFAHIAPYISDARSKKLELLGAGHHDWSFLLSEFGLLEWDTQFGLYCRCFAAICFLVFLIGNILPCFGMKHA